MKLLFVIPVLTSLLCLSHTAATAQSTVIDSLQQAFYQEQNDSLRWELAYRLYQEYRFSQLDSAYYWCAAGHRLAEQAGRPYQLGVSHFRLGIAAFNLRSYEEAMQHQLKAIGYLRPLHQDSMIVEIDYEIGRIDARQGNYVQAKAAYDRYYQHHRKMGDGLSLIYVLSEYGALYEWQHQYDSVLFYAQQALQVAKEQGLPQFLSAIHSNIAAGYYLTQKYEQALVHYRSTLRHLSPDDLKQRYYINYGMGNTYYDLRQLDSAVYYYHKALEAAREFGDISVIADANRWLADAYALQSNYQSAYQHLLAYKQAGDSLSTELHQKSLAALSLEYDTQKKEDEIARQRLLLERESDRRKMTLLGSVLGLVLLAGGMLYYRHRQQIARRRAGLELQLQQKEAERLQELDRMKSGFFANISHEFRTPLTLILGPLRQMYAGTFTGDAKHYQKVMIRHAERLLQLVNQLLELSRLEGGQVELAEKEQDLSGFIRSLVFSYESWAMQKQIHYQCHFPDYQIRAAFDADKLEKIIGNLLSNAFKFCPENGRVQFSMSTSPAEKPHNLRLHLVISDNGPGIAEADLPFIFDRFYNKDQKDSHFAGAGIGLALSRELVRLHAGQIEVDSKAGAGTTFRVTLPLSGAIVTETSEAVQSQKQPVAGYARQESLTANAAQAAIYPDRTSVLVVEDNPDLRMFINDQLKAQYHILEAGNGQAGLELAREYLPDLIITDVMMPQMDGHRFCRLLKTDERTSHIPVIQLTARAEQKDRLEGLKYGADAFLTKPFDPEELRLRVTKLIEQRQVLREKFASRITSYSLEVKPVDSMEAQFLQKCVQEIEGRISDEDFSITDLAGAVNMSRSQLHRKIKVLTGDSPSVFIRTIRLQHAYHLLQQRAGNISEIAFEVGIPNLAYFSRCFSQQFGFPPSEVLHKA